MENNQNFLKFFYSLQFNNLNLKYRVYFKQMAKSKNVKKAAKKKVTQTQPPAKKKIVKPKKAPVKIERKASTRKSINKAATSEEKPQRAKRQPAEKKKKAAISIVGYNAAELEAYKEQKHKLAEKTNAELKEMLKKNDQTCTGTKDELIEKIADGKVLGKIPRCSHCFGGRLRFNYKTGLYKCPGYRDDTDFHNCQRSFKLEEVKRDAWID